MKFLILCTAILFTFSISKGQTEKGDRLVGGSGFVSTQFDNFSLILNPDVGWFVRNNFALGTGIALNYYAENTSYSSVSIGLSPDEHRR